MRPKQEKLGIQDRNPKNKQDPGGGKIGIGIRKIGKIETIMGKTYENKRGKHIRPENSYLLPKQDFPIFLQEQGKTQEKRQENSTNIEKFLGLSQFRTIFLFFLFQEEKQEKIGQHRKIIGTIVGNQDKPTRTNLGISLFSYFFLMFFLIFPILGGKIGKKQENSRKLRQT